MLKDEIIVPSQSPLSAPLVIVPKKDGNDRICVDFRNLNKVTKADAYPMPRIDEALDALGNAKFVSSLDLQTGYWQVPMHKESQELTAFSSPLGHFEFSVMPFGLKNAGATCQRLMELILSGLQVQALSNLHRRHFNLK
jgi:hypothetical protein